MQDIKMRETVSVVAEIMRNFSVSASNHRKKKKLSIITTTSISSRQAHSETNKTTAKSAELIQS